jgi:uncharacterized pyridoxal phosphate-containing UPF0001 family protein
VSPSQLADLYKAIREKCQNLHILGIMCIGSYEQSTNENEINQDFKVGKLKKCTASISLKTEKNIIIHSRY